MMAIAESDTEDKKLTDKFLVVLLLLLVPQSSCFQPLVNRAVFRRAVKQQRVRCLLNFSNTIRAWQEQGRTMTLVYQCSDWKSQVRNHTLHRDSRWKTNDPWRQLFFFFVARLAERDSRSTKHEGICSRDSLGHYRRETIPYDSNWVMASSACTLFSFTGRWKRVVVATADASAQAIISSEQYDPSWTAYSPFVTFLRWSFNNYTLNGKFTIVLLRHACDESSFQLRPYVLI